MHRASESQLNLSGIQAQGSGVHGQASVISGQVSVIPGQTFVLPGRAFKDFLSLSEVAPGVSDAKVILCEGRARLFMTYHRIMNLSRLSTISCTRPEMSSQTKIVIVGSICLETTIAMAPRQL